MRTPHVPLRTLAFALALALSTPAWTASPWVYRGALLDAGQPAQGSYGFRLSFHDAATGGRELVAPISLSDVAVAGGAFEAMLELDAAVTARETAWLQVEVRDESGSFVQVGEREEVHPKAATAGVCWDTAGNAAIVGEFLGTTNLVPLELRANGVRALHLDAGAQTGTALAPNVIAGGSNNVNTGSNTSGITIAGGGGVNNGSSVRNNASANWATIGGGHLNAVQGLAGTVAGGTENVVVTAHGAVGGGFSNEAFASHATIAGGQNGGVSPGATAGAVGGGLNSSVEAPYGVVAGGANNAAQGFGSVVPGGQANFARGDFSLAAGRRAIVRGKGEVAGEAACTVVGTCGDEGTFVWADNTDADFISTGPKQFLVRASGGFGLNTTPPTAANEFIVRGNDGNGDINVFPRDGTMGYSFVATDPGVGDATSFFIMKTNATSVFTQRVEITNGGFVGLNRGTISPIQPLQVGTSGSDGNGAHVTSGGVWTNGSSRAFKRAFAAVDVGAVLEKVLDLPLTTWSYRDSNEGRHLGPVAEDFHAAFGLGDGEQYISTVDADGVALAAIQGLAARVQDENDALRERVARLEAVIERLSGERAIADQ